MSYSPSANDVNDLMPSASYQPSLNDINDLTSSNQGEDAKAALRNMLWSGSVGINQPKPSPDPHNGLYNPGNYLNPLVQMGKMAPQPSTEHPLLRSLALAAIPTMVPEAKIAELLGGSVPAQLADWVGNTAIRGGAMTGAGTLNQMTTPGNQSSWTDALKSNAENAGLMEAGALPVRAIKGIGELYNPQKFADAQVQNMQNNFQDIKQRMNTAYAGGLNKLGPMPVTNDPKNYFNFKPSIEQHFTADVDKAITTFNEEPNLNNLHELQSQMGQDAAAGDTNAERQALTQARKNVTDKIQTILSVDPQAQASYNLGTQISRDEYYPHFANPTLSGIATGLKKSVSPSQLQSSIQKAIEKQKPGARPGVSIIPQDHYLQNILPQIKSRLAIGEASKTLIPTLGMAGGALAGNYLDPGSLGILEGGGLVGGATRAAPFLTQNPSMQALGSLLSKLYYGGGLAAMAPSSK